VNALTIAGTAAGALIAVGTVLHWTIRHAIRVGTWAAAAVRLPAVVDDLAVAVTTLSTSVTTLSTSVDQLQHQSTLENA
jgi:outer membrane murein-binding lipoprotein Lpp